MKRMILAVVVGVGALIGLGLAMNRSKTAVSKVEKASEVASAPAQIDRQPVNREAELRQGTTQRKSRTEKSATGAAAAEGHFDFSQAIETLISPRASFAQKQAAWDGLTDAGQTDQAISELEQRVANDPQSADLAAALGIAYMKNCATMTDVREQAIPAMKADKTLERALKLDPSNWDARFIKAVGLSYWPANLNKSQEVIDQFLTLIQQQEAQPAQPHFAQPYLWLGDQYQKAGQTENAMQVWQRGAALFPRNNELQNKLASVQP